MLQRVSRWRVHLRIGAASALLLVAGLLFPAVALAQDPGGTLWSYATQNWVVRVAASADGSRIAVGSRDNSVHLIDRQGKVLWSFQATNSVTGLAMTPDARFVAVASEDRQVALLDSAGKLLWRASESTPVRNVALADDGSLVVASASGQTLYAYSQSGQQLWKTTLGNEIPALAIYGTGENARVVAGGLDASLTIFSRTGQQLLRTSLDHDIVASATTPNGGRIVLATSERAVHLLDGSNGRQIWRYPATDDIHDLAMNADASLILVGLQDGSALLLNGSGELISTIPVGPPVLAVALSRDGSTLVFGTANNIAVAVDRRGYAEAFQSTQTTQSIERDAAIGLVVLLLALVVGYLLLTPSGKQTTKATSRDLTGMVREVWKHRLSYLLLLPTFALLLVFNYYPAASALYHAFTNWQPGIRTTWVGFANFEYLTHDSYFLASVVNVVILVLTTLAKTFTVPLLVAELIFGLKGKRIQYWWRTLYVIPLVVPSVALILVWQNILDPNIGLINETVNALGMPSLSHAWLGDPATALPSIIFVGFPWAQAFPILIFYGGLISIPADLFDSARVDGASLWRRFWNVDVPLLMSQVKLLLILGIIAGFETFELVFLTTGGGPGSSTYTPALELYYSAMQFDRMGLASAIGILIFVVILGLSVATQRFIHAATEFEG